MRAFVWRRNNKRVFFCLCHCIKKASTMSTPLFLGFSYDRLALDWLSCHNICIYFLKIFLEILEKVMLIFLNSTKNKTTNPLLEFVFILNLFKYISNIASLLFMVFAFVFLNKHSLIHNNVKQDTLAHTTFHWNSLIANKKYTKCMCMFEC